MKKKEEQYARIRWHRPLGSWPNNRGGRGFCVVPISPSSLIYMAERDYRHTDVPVSTPYYGTRQNTPGAVPYASQLTRKQELDFLNEQYQAMRRHRELIEKRIQRLQNNRSAL
jgi:hypothetical protein